MLRLSVFALGPCLLLHEACATPRHQVLNHINLFEVPVSESMLAV